MSENLEQSSRNAFYTAQSTPQVIQLRLDTTQLIRDYELFLRGEQLIAETDKNGQTAIKKIVTGERLMNDKGVQCLLMTVSQTINSAGVQGNWKSEYFEQFINEADKNLSCDLMTNLHKWNVSLTDYNVICNSFINLLQQFASRLIENKERESYMSTLRSDERVIQQAPKGSNSLFGGG